MGIKGLWKIVEPAHAEHSLLMLTTIEGYHGNQAKRSLIIGVDTSLWIDSSQAAFQGATIHTHSGENPELRVFFYKLCHYLKLPVVLVFVLDGPGRPSTKRGRKVQAQPIWMTSYLEELVTAFGFYVHRAPGEAEAELAKLNSSGMIDAILTDDSDTLVFGGECIIRSAAKSDGFDRVRLYVADSIQYSNDVKLNRGGLLLYALLAGGDYDSGVKSCGPRTAHALAQCGFGDDLLIAAVKWAESLGGPEFQSFLCSWWDSLRSELETNSCGFLKCRKPAVAQNIHDDFPDREVLSEYLFPLTSWSPQPGCQIPNAANWRSTEPSIARITAFCVQRFGWGKDAEVVARFHSKLWEGVAFRMLCSPLVLYDGTRHFLATPTANTVLRSQTGSKTMLSRSTPSRRLTISTKNFQDLMGAPWANLSSETDSISLHIPISILQTAVPSILDSQTKAKRHSKQKMATASGMSIDNTPVSKFWKATDVTEISEDDLPIASGSGPVSSEVIELTDSDEGSVIDLT